MDELQKGPMVRAVGWLRAEIAAGRATPEAASWVSWTLLRLSPAAQQRVTRKLVLAELRFADQKYSHSPAPSQPPGADQA